ncbi:uncharacterized protein FIBRA_07343 [Fibroporia radiculosa]|uniref:BTB domain-containing protein n=1 Tax=Fibroporia radiculosa TaxID=599839 RepID=J4GUR6_9APHY|nr:uncharacterized protein FIBRA_07343 [Fibroporia radiculosa]CCM05135.1 predicted protein [Fibroporia radiculosa]
MSFTTFWCRVLPRFYAPFVVMSTLNLTNGGAILDDGGGYSRHSAHEIIQPHPRYWLSDGSLIVRTQGHAFKIHRTLLHRHSPVLAALSTSQEANCDSMHGCPLVYIPDERGVSSADFEALLAHLYHDTPIDSDAPFSHLAAVLRASSKEQLDFPSIHELVRRRLGKLIPSELEALLKASVEQPDEALTLAVEYDIDSIKKSLFYVLATHADLDHDEPDGMLPVPDAPVDSTPSQPRFNLSPALTRRCQALLDELVAHFTPILFTVATAHHMACTDIFAETWMPLVIQPALESSGLCRPLETLQTIIELDWAAHGLCEECVRDKREEWRGEQKAIWDRMDGWLALTVKA